MSKQALISKAKELLSGGFSIIPTKQGKIPALSWKIYQSERIKEVEVKALFDKEDVKGLGIVCGAISGSLEVIDVDTKHDTTGTLWDELRGLIEDNLSELYPSLIIAQTISGGYHIYYRCSSIAGNLKLANKDTREALIETRGEGGYVVAPPSEGYKYIQGDPVNTPTITPEERDQLFRIAKSFNELEDVGEQPKPDNHRSSYNGTGISPFEDYNQRGDVVALLECKGWQVVKQQGQRIQLKRDGNTTAKTSGNFHTGLRTLRVFSTSTEFNPDKAYNPSQVFSLLEFNEDHSAAAKELIKMGYGDRNQRTSVKTTSIEVISVNSVTNETSVISKTGENLSIEALLNASGDEIIVSSNIEAQAEVVEAINLIQRTGKRAYVKEGSQPPQRDYKYLLSRIFDKYAGEISDPQIDNFLDEVVTLSAKLQPIDKAMLLKLFISMEPIKELGITEESLSITVDRLTTTTDKEAQSTEFKELLLAATELQDKGETDKALELLDSKVKEVKLKDKATEFNGLMIPIKEEELKERQANKPQSVNSGYTIGGEDLLLPSGAISVFAAPTSHGKTTFLINMALNVAKASTEKETYLFSYEEDGDSILMNALNTYLNKSLSANNRKSIKSYFSTNSTEFIKAESTDYFTSQKDSFFKELIDTRRLNIHYITYNSDTIIEAIRYLHKHANPEAIFIDYIQLLNLPNGKYKTYSRQEEIKEICIALKDVAVETGLPIILGAQFNRTVINQLHLHPTKIGEAGDIERIANLIVGFWNNSLLSLASEGELDEINRKKMNAKGTLYTTILKNRGGRVGLEEALSFNGNTGVIKNRSEVVIDAF